MAQKNHKDNRNQTIVSAKKEFFTELFITNFRIYYHFRYKMKNSKKHLKPKNYVLFKIFISI